MGIEVVDARALSAHGSIADNARNDRREMDMPEIVLRNQRNFILSSKATPDDADWAFSQVLGIQAYVTVITAPHRVRR